VPNKKLSQKEIIELADNLESIDQSFKPDKWQRQVLEHEGNIILRTGRQVGKSETVGKKCAKEAIRHKNITILMIAAAQRQSSEIFQKTLRNLYKVHDAMLKEVGGFQPDPTKSPRQNDDDRKKFEAEYGLFKGNITRTECNLINGVRILSLPTGKTGAFVRCYTVDILIADEAAYIAEAVWVAIKPMLATSKKMRGLGWEILLSTPFGKGGYYYDACHSPDFLHIHVSSEDCPRIGRDFLQKEKQRLSRMEYAQEYLGDFVSEFHQFFPSELIKKRMNFIDWSLKEKDISKYYYMGVDVARYGEDESAVVIGELDPITNFLRIVKCLTWQHTSLTSTCGRINRLHQEYGFKRIFIDDGGVGGGLTDMLKEDIGRSRVVPLNNSQKSIENNRNKGLLKEDLYSNALSMMEKDSPSQIAIVSDMKLLRSLRSMTFEYTREANIRIYGADSHLAEAFVRCCWCVKSKGLNLFVA
jgi:hypothetical protein